MNDRAIQNNQKSVGPRNTLNIDLVLQAEQERQEAVLVQKSNKKITEAAGKVKISNTALCPVPANQQKQEIPQKKRALNYPKSKLQRNLSTNSFLKKTSKDPKLQQYQKRINSSLNTRGQHKRDNSASLIQSSHYSSDKENKPTQIQIDKKVSNKDKGVLQSTRNLKLKQPRQQQQKTLAPLQMSRGLGSQPGSTRSLHSKEKSSITFTPRSTTSKQSSASTLRKQDPKKRTPSTTTLPKPRDKKYLEMPILQSTGRSSLKKRTNSTSFKTCQTESQYFTANEKASELEIEIDDQIEDEEPTFRSEVRGLDSVTNKKSKQSYEKSVGNQFVAGPVNTSQQQAFYLTGSQTAPQVSNFTKQGTAVTEAAQVYNKIFQHHQTQHQSSQLISDITHLDALKVSMKNSESGLLDASFPQGLVQSEQLQLTQNKMLTQRLVESRCSIKQPEDGFTMKIQRREEEEETRRETTEIDDLAGDFPSALFDEHQPNQFSERNSIENLIVSLSNVQGVKAKVAKPQLTARSSGLHQCNLIKQYSQSGICKRRPSTNGRVIRSSTLKPTPDTQPIQLLNKKEETFVKAKLDQVPQKDVSFGSVALPTLKTPISTGDQVDPGQPLVANESSGRSSVQFVPNQTNTSNDNENKTSFNDISVEPAQCQHNITNEELISESFNNTRRKLKKQATPNKSFDNNSVSPLQASEDSQNQIEDQKDQVCDSALQNNSPLHRLHLLQTIQSLIYLQKIDSGIIKTAADQLESVYLPPPTQAGQIKTLIFDLDETLVHCLDTEDSMERVAAGIDNSVEQIPQFNIKIKSEETQEVFDAGINLRPYVKECLAQVSSRYQVGIFTASHKEYADAVIKLIDPDESLIQFRLYRQHCYQTKDGIYIKDLRVIKNRNLKDVLLVDNSVYSFGFQLENGVPIIPYLNESQDQELVHLASYALSLSYCDDLRPQNAQTFQLKELQKANLQAYLNEFYLHDKELTQGISTNLDKSTNDDQFEDFSICDPAPVEAESILLQQRQETINEESYEESESRSEVRQVSVLQSNPSNQSSEEEQKQPDQPPVSQIQQDFVDRTLSESKSDSDFDADEILEAKKKLDFQVQDYSENSQRRRPAKAGEESETPKMLSRLTDTDK